MNTDPTTLAREVLKQAAMGPNEPDDRGPFWMADAAPDLARAVLAVADLADGYIERYDRHPDIEGDYPQGVVVTAKAIRAALNGGDA